MAFTYFFRDTQTLEIATEYFIPAVMGRKYIRIWDAGCAMGPEPYSLAIMLAEKMGNFAFRNVHIDATDIDESNLLGEIISNGVYPEDQLKRIPSEIFNKYFETYAVPGHFKIVDKIRKRVNFQRHNLLSLKPVGDNYNMILCKNVLLHFKEEERIAIIKMFYKALTKSGYLVVEQTQKLPEQVTGLFEQVSGNVQVLRKV